MEQYKVAEVHTTNLRNVIDVTFIPGERVVKISGKNGSGKSTIIESIFLGLCGTKVIERGMDQSMLVRQGEKEATIQITLSGPRNIKVTRKITAQGNTSVEFRASDGQKLYQKDVDEILSMSSVDPMQVIRMNEKEQTLYIKQITGLDTSDIDQQINNKDGSLYLERTAQGIRKREAEAVLADMGNVVPGDRVDTQGLIEKYNEMIEFNNQQDMTQERIANAGILIQKEQDEIKEIESQIQELENRKIAKTQQINGRTQKVKELKDEIKPKKDTTEIKSQIDNAEAINTQANAFDAWVKQSEKVEDETVKYQSINEKIKTLTDEKLDRIRKANMPIENMEIDEDNGIMINGKSMKHQYNTAEQIRFAMRIVLFANPQLRLVYIKDGSLLDEDTLQKVCQEAEELDAQVFIERVGEEAETIVMRDGLLYDNTK